MLQHISRNESCKAKYGDTEFETLKAASKQRSKREYKQNNKATIAEKKARYNAKYNAQNKEERSKGNAEYHQKRKAKQLPADRILAFRQDIIEGPNFVCQSCNRCLFKKSVKILNDKQEETLIGKTGIDFYQTIISHNNNTITCPIFCHTCFNTLSKSTPENPKRPKLHVSNGLYLDPVPPELKLTELEQQLIALVQIFMKIKKLPKSQMAAVVDKVINVPMELQDIEKTVSSLPRPLDGAEIIAVKLKRKMSLKSCYAEAFISPDRVLAAVMKLKELDNPHYRNIKIDPDFFKQQGDIIEEDMEIDEAEAEESDDESSGLLAVREFQSLQDSHTCLAPMDLEDQVVTNDSKETITRRRSAKATPFAIAPGENKLPAHASSIKHVDEKGFPCHYPTGRWGFDEPREQELTIQEFNNQRFLNEDERLPNDKACLFFSQGRQERDQLESYIQIAGTTGKVSGKDGNVELKLHDSCNVFQKIKGTPKYWQAARNELIAKVKQLGPFHLFFTLSCGEMRWTEVFISVLRRTGRQVDIIKDSNGKWSGKDEDILVEGLPLWNFVDSLGSTRLQLLKGYEFLITRHFDNRVKEFIKNIVMGPGQEKVKIAYYNYR